jgi:hypothetical protein
MFGSIIKIVVYTGAAIVLKKTGDKIVKKASK